MKSKNICKFIPASIADKLDIKCFIYESNFETMSTKYYCEDNRAILIKNGGGKFFFDDSEFRAEAGNLLFLFEKEYLYIIPDDECEYMYISFSGTRSYTLFRRFGINKINRCFTGFDSLVPFWHESLTRASQINIDLAAESVLLYTFSRLSTDNNEKNNLINTIIEITENNFTDSALSVSKIADKLAYNPKYISHIFKEKIGIGYSQYLRNIRIKHAVTLIDHGLDSVKNIAILSGFMDPLYFSAVFKKVVGISPKEYMTRGKRE